MNKISPFLFFATSLPAMAAPPVVVTDIAPVHSLVSQVLGDLGEAELLLDQGTDPHHANLRPSQATSLQSAGVLFWIGESLTPWLEEGVETLGRKSVAIELLKVEGTKIIETEEEDGHDDHGNEEDHDDHGHVDEDKHEDDEEHAGHDHPDHGGVDPHAWLDPKNGIVWLGAMADALSKVDPENAATYTANAAAGIASLEALIKEIEARDLPHNIPAVPAHSFLAYYEDRFHYHAMLPLKNVEGDNAEASAISKLQEIAQSGAVKCFFFEAGEDAGSYASFESDFGLKLIEIDQLGANLDLGAALYGDVIRSVTDSFASCEG